MLTNANRIFSENQKDIVERADAGDVICFCAIAFWLILQQHPSTDYTVLSYVITGFERCMKVYEDEILNAL